MASLPQNAVVLPGATFLPGTSPIPAGASASASMPILPGGPSWLSFKNLLIGGAIAGGLYVAYALLLPPKKKPAGTAPVVAGFGWFKKRRRRRR